MMLLLSSESLRQRIACYLPFDIIIVYLLRIMNNNAVCSSDRNIANDYNADVIVVLINNE